MKDDFLYSIVGYFFETKREEEVRKTSLIHKLHPRTLVVAAVNTILLIVFASVLVAG